MFTPRPSRPSTLSWRRCGGKFSQPSRRQVLGRRAGHTRRNSSRCAAIGHPRRPPTRPRWRGPLDRNWANSRDLAVDPRFGCFGSRRHGATGIGARALALARALARSPVPRHRGRPADLSAVRTASDRAPPTEPEEAGAHRRSARCRVRAGGRWDGHRWLPRNCRRHHDGVQPSNELAACQATSTHHHAGRPADHRCSRGTCSTADRRTPDSSPSEAGCDGAPGTRDDADCPTPDRTCDKT
jgi:hypothetical protein